MRATTFSLLTGLAASAIFEVINYSTHLLDGWRRLCVLGFIFIIFSIVALFFSKSDAAKKVGIGSNNRSGGRLDIGVRNDSQSNADIGSGNTSKSDMKIDIH